MPAEEENTIFKKKEAAALAECAKAHSFFLQNLREYRKNELHEQHV